MAEKPLVSVIIPAYNAEPFIFETVRSVIEQSYPSIEIIVVNDGSKDNTKGKLEPLIDKIRYYEIPNQGVSAARNFGFEQALGEILVFLDADDLFFPHNIAKKVAFLQENPSYDVVYSDYITFDTNTLQPLSYVFAKSDRVLFDLLETAAPTGMMPSNVMMTRKAFIEVGGFDTQMSTSADWELFIRLAHRFKVGSFNEPLVKYRLHPLQMHRNIDVMEQDQLYGYEKAWQLGLYKNYWHYRYCKANMFLILSASFLRHTNKRGKFLKYLFYSFIYNPIHIIKKLFKR